jgi:hypothetical protein
MPGQLEAGHQISVVAIAETAPPHWGFCFIGEELTTHTAFQLTTVLLTIKRSLGLELHEALAFLIQEHLQHSDLLRAAWEAKQSILVEGPWEQLGISDADYQERLSILRRKPVWQLQVVLNRWTTYGGRFPTRFLENPDFQPKVVSYLTIPHVSSEDISGERAKQILVPVLVELGYKPFFESFLAMKREGHSADIFIDFRDPNTQPQSVGAAEQSISLQENDSQSGFTHSPDFRSVSLHGQHFTLTSIQAQVVEYLYGAYKNGTPEVGQHIILTKLELGSTRLRDIFRSTPGVWGKLVPCQISIDGSMAR